MVTRAQYRNVLLGFTALAMAIAGVLPLGCDFVYDNPVEECNASVCITEISGTILLADESDPFVGSLWSCCTIQDEAYPCVTGETSESGVFSFRPCGDVDYIGFDPENGDSIHLTIPKPGEELDGERITNYVVGYTPEPMDLDEDNTFDTGTHYLYSVEGDTAQYHPDTGAVLTGSLSGVSFTIAPGALGGSSETIDVFPFPLEEWRPPFLKDLEVDALHYLAPYFEEVDDSNFISIEIDPTSVPNWSQEGDTGVLYMLGDYRNGYLDCGDGEIEVSDFAVCDDQVVLEDGVIKTRISRLGWMALKKD